jgi:hypothetical protein
MRFWTMTLGPLRRQIAQRPPDEVANPATMPEHLLFDIGMSRDGVPSLARQLRREGEP